MSLRYTCGDCGYAGLYRTQALADFHFPKHSCRKERERQARARRIRARIANRDGIRRDCTHPIARHEHGTRNAYVLDRCRCASCKDAARAYEAERTRLHMYGRWTHRADAAPVRAHLRALMAAGVSYKQTAKLAGVPLTTVSQIIYGKPDRRDHEPPLTCSTDTATKILAVQPNPWALSDRVLIDATGSQRRVQALVALGWSQSIIAERLGIVRTNFTLMKRAWITVRYAKAIRELYEELWNTPPAETTHRERISASRARNYAADHGWFPPLAWDDESIDDPASEPMSSEPVDTDEVVIQRLMAGELRATRHTRSAETVEAVRRLAALGLSDSRIADRVGMSTTAVCATRLRNDIPPGIPSTRTVA